MSEVAIRHEAAVAVSGVDAQYERLALWAQSAQAAHQVAVSLVQTSFVPQAFRGKPGEATAAILAGIEVGINPMASLRAFDVIQGTAAPKAITLRAIVQSRGHKMWVKESTATRCIVEGCRRGETEVQSSTWTIERAKQLSLTGKENWKNQPIAMLLARATSECARLVAADAILGIPYSSEELADGVMAEPVTVIEAKAAPTRTIRRAPLPTAEPEPEFDDDPDPIATQPELPAPDAKPISSPQSKMLHALLNKTGRGDRDVGLVYISGVLEREVTTTKELSTVDASRVIDALNAEAAGDGDGGDGGWPEVAG